MSLGYGIFVLLLFDKLDKLFIFYLLVSGQTFPKSRLFINFMLYIVGGDVS